MRIKLIATALIALPLLAACGGSDAEATVTEADLSKSMQDKGMQDKALADCVAKVFVAEGISQDGLRTLMSGEHDPQSPDAENFGMSKEDADKTRAAQGKIVTECVKLPS
ncbi:hypothetical protein GV791_26430 [Nocardia cyriacigeorgica]|uniref:Lipoprotein n=2 Tax=Nocardia cyriacigeorgica TaxID=135487 RepID=H6R7D3_NOCCG|nr:hypothetical protein [Nocardia cyriacigeorgica]MBF6082512.1 hypothetical protein [Nocardia cyriacigeorgica]MBF6287726.1 hypothetical protein [Nocardia cyriacigeorgica]MBF6425383.1 hypothetical protein [Nocardia cyriacigeorgica]NEW36078.1 hypothetical protein [Nocardia cyriacigeorgica]CCF66051.1 exported protein of unknown function [Nocardia cyriacigeorgica GUH-2]